MDTAARDRSLEAERALLGAIVVENAHLAEVSELIAPADFMRDAHTRIYEAMLELDAERTTIDFITLRNALSTRGDLEDAGGPAYIASLVDGVPRTTNAQYYAAIVREKALLRDLRGVAQRTIASINGDDADSRNILATLEHDLYRLGARAARSEWTSGSQLAHELFPVIEQLLETRDGLRGLSTGFNELDALLRGLQKGDIIIVAARPSMGKTALVNQAALRVAQSAPVAMFSLEMSKQALALRAMISLSGVNGWRVLSGRMSDDDQMRIGQGIAALGERAIYVDDVAQRTALSVRSRLRRLQAEVGPLGLVIIDYLQLLLPFPEDRRENRTNQVANISRALKLLARELDVPFLVVSQLNRGLERSADKRPTLADLRDSGAIEQDADVVLLLHRPEVYDPKPDNKGIAEVIIAKHRNGPQGEIKLAWLETQMEFRNLQR